MARHPEVTFVAVGDIMLGSKVETVIEQRGAEYIFQQVAPMMRKADIVFANLEAPFGTGNHKAIWDYSKLGDGGIYLKANPDSVQGLTYVGLDIVSLANNHIMDYGSKGLSDTINTLAKANIKCVGAGKDIREARTPAILQVNGLKVGFLAYCEVYLATKRKPGCASLDSSIYRQIRNLKTMTDIVIVSLHYGMTAADYPMSSDIKLAHAIIDSGADMVLRHHPHVLQGIEFYKKGLIAYSLGNFVFDCNIDPSWAGIKKARESMILQCNLSKNGIKEAKIVPTFINDDYQPELLTGEAGNRILQRMNQLSSKLKDKDILAEEDMKYVEIAAQSLSRLSIAILQERKFGNIFLIARRFRLYHIWLLIRYLISCIRRFMRLKRE